MRKILVSLLIMLSFAAAAKDATLYDRVAARLARDPKLAAALGHAAPKMKQTAWMIKNWDIMTTIENKQGADKGRSVVTSALGGVWLEIRDTYPQGNQNISYLNFNPVTKR